MKKISILLLTISLLFLTGCTTHKSFTYNVETGDSIQVELNTTDGYDLSSDLPFTISKDNVTLSQGTFIKGEYYSQYVDIAKNDESTKLLDSGSNDDIEYIFYSYNDSEWDYVIKVKNSDTAIVLGNPNSKEEAEKCFKLLSFELK